MNELEPNKIQLIDSFIKATNANTIKWDKDKARGFNCFYCLISNQKVLSDKYYQDYYNNETKVYDVRECFNFTILDSHDKIIIEILACFGINPGYDLLKNLYETIEIQYKATVDKNISPILSQLADSLQKSLAIN